MKNKFIKLIIVLIILAISGESSTSAGTFVEHPTGPGELRPLAKGERVTSTMDKASEMLGKNRSLQEALGDIIQFLAIEAVESDVTCFADGEIGKVHEGQATRVAAISTGSYMIVDYAALEEMVLLRSKKPFIAVHSHPVTLLANSIVDAVPIPSDEDVDTSDRKENFALIVWGEVGLGWYASLIDIKRIGNYSKWRQGLSVTDVMRRLAEMKAVKFFNLGVSGASFGDTVAHRSLRYIPREISIERAIAGYGFIKRKASIVRQREAVRREKWHRRAYNEYLEMPEVKVKEKLKFPVLQTLLHDYENGLMTITSSSRVHEILDIEHLIRKEMTGLHGVREALIDRANGFQQEIGIIDRLSKRAVVSLAKGYGFASMAQRPVAQTMQRRITPSIYASI